MKTETIISLSAMIDFFFITFALFGVVLGIAISFWFLLMTPIGLFFAWASMKIFDDWNHWHSYCVVMYDHLYENHYFREDIKRLKN